MSYDIREGAFMVSLEASARTARNHADSFADTLSHTLWRLNCPADAAGPLLEALDLTFQNVRAGAAAEQTIVLHELSAGLPMDVLEHVHANYLPTPTPDEED